MGSRELHTHRIITDGENIRARNKLEMPDNRRELRVHPTVYMHACVVTVWQSTNQPGELANPVHGQLNGEKLPCPRSRLRIWFRKTGLAVSSRVSLLILHTLAESGA